MLGYGEIVGVVVKVRDDGGPPFVVRWYDDDTESKISPNPECYWIRSRRRYREVQATRAALHRVA